MKYPARPKVQLTAASVLVMMASGVLAQSAATAGDEAPSYRPLALMNQPPTLQRKSDYAGAMELGAAYTSDDNYMFGQYNGLSEEEVTLIGNLSWQNLNAGDGYWQVSLSDLGLDTRQGQVTWGIRDQVKVSLEFDAQQQERNNSGATPFLGDSDQQLPGNWVAGLTTGEFSSLDSALQTFDRTLDRDRVTLGAEARLNKNWQLETSLSYEEKEGYGETGAGIYIDGSSADAVLLRSPVNYRTTEFDLGLSYDAERLHLRGQVSYSDFDNKDDALIWQNPYSAFGPSVAYPNGNGGLSVTPDNEHVSGRLTGHYIFSSTTRLQFDSSYAVASQDQSYLPYSANTAATLTTPLPRESFDGEVATTTTNIRLLLRPMPKLSTELFYKLRDRDYDASRDGYLYVRGDAGDQPEAALTVYNSTHDLTTQTAGFEASYRLPRRSKLGFEYAYINTQRSNAAVEETEEDRYTLSYRIQPSSTFSARTQLQFADRAADTYEWAQSYYSLLDTQLINATPDNQRYINHPNLQQHHLANRERWEGKVDLSYLPAPSWNLNLNLLWRDDDYDKSKLGLTRSQWGRAHFSAVFTISDTMSAGAYAGYDRFEGSQSSRAFRGGQEKNAFAVYAPLPLASDPTQDWNIDATDSSVSVGVNLQWQLSPEIQLNFDYNLVNTTGEQAFATPVASSLSVSDLPDVDTRLHQIEASGVWQLRSNLSLQLAYQFYSYKTNDWAWNNLQADTLDKVLTFGQTNPNEDIHYVGASVRYYWQ